MKKADLGNFELLYFLGQQNITKVSIVVVLKRLCQLTFHHVYMAYRSADGFKYPAPGLEAPTLWRQTRIKTLGFI